MVCFHLKDYFQVLQTLMVQYCQLLKCKDRAIFKTELKIRFLLFVLLCESDEVLVVGVHVGELAVDQHQNLVFASLKEIFIKTFYNCKFTNSLN